MVGIISENWDVDNMMPRTTQETIKNGAVLGTSACSILAPATCMESRRRLIGGLSRTDGRPVFHQWARESISAQAKDSPE